MKNSLLKSISVFALTMTLSFQAFALDIVISPIFLLGSNGANYPGVTTSNAIEAIGNARNVVGVIAGILMIPLAILNEKGEVVKPGVSIENLLAQGYTLEEIEQFDRDQVRIFETVGGKRMTVEQFMQTLQNLELAETSRQILGL